MYDHPWLHCPKHGNIFHNPYCGIWKCPRCEVPMAIQVAFSFATERLPCAGQCQRDEPHYLGTYQLGPKEPVLKALLCAICHRATLLMEKVEAKAA